MADDNELDQLRDIVAKLEFFDSFVKELGWGNAEMIELSYRHVLWALGHWRKQHAT